MYVKYPFSSSSVYSNYNENFTWFKYIIVNSIQFNPLQYVMCPSSMFQAFENGFLTSS